MKYHFRIHKEGRGYWAECIEIEGCLTQGDSKAELLENMHEVLNLALDEPQGSKIIFPMPKKRVSGKGIAAVAVEPKIAFSLRLRQLRLKKKLTQKQVAQMLGFKNIYSYQRLENSRTANPALMTIAQIKEIFPELDIDEVIGL